MAHGGAGGFVEVAIGAAETIVAARLLVHADLPKSTFRIDYEAETTRFLDVSAILTNVAEIDDTLVAQTTDMSIGEASVGDDAEAVLVVAHFLDGEDFDGAEGRTFKLFLRRNLARVAVRDKIVEHILRDVRWLH